MRSFKIFSIPARKYLSAALVLTVFGCTFERCEPILKADFSTHATGSSPDMSLPGDPDGDMIWYSLEAGSELRIGSDKMLSYKSRVYFYPQYLGFYPKKVLINQPMYYFWKGVPNIKGLPLTVFFGDGHFEEFGGIRFDTDGSVKIRGSAAPQDYVSLGTYRNGIPHFVSIRYDPEARIYRLRITPDSGEPIDSGDRPMIGTIPKSENYPAIYFTYPNSEKNYESAAPSEYKFRFLNVNKKLPD